MNHGNETTKLKFADAIRYCMTTKPVEAITVREICRQGNLSRQSFYRCFKDKYDLINWYFDRILRESFHQMGNGRTVRESLLLKFQYIQKEYVFFRAAFSTDTQNNLRQHDFEMIFAFYKDLISRKSGKAFPAELTAVLEMYCNASVYMTVKWVMQDMPCTPAELAQTMIDAMPAKLIEIFHTCQLM